jgi:hypothetical protein
MRFIPTERRRGSMASSFVGSFMGRSAALWWKSAPFEIETPFDLPETINQRLAQL